MIVAVTKHVTFDSAHYLVNPKWTREENIARFHKCCLYKPDGSDQPHGHTYHLEVTVQGEVDPDTGFVIDFKDLKRILNEGVIETLDHFLINEIPYFKNGNIPATAENIIQYIWSWVDGDIRGTCWLESLKLYETPDSYAYLDRKMNQKRTCGCTSLQPKY